MINTNRKIEDLQNSIYKHNKAIEMCLEEISNHQRHIVFLTSMLTQPDLPFDEQIEKDDKKN